MIDSYQTPLQMQYISRCRLTINPSCIVTSGELIHCTIDNSAVIDGKPIPGSHVHSKPRVCFKPCVCFNGCLSLQLHKHVMNSSEMSTLDTW